MTTQTKILLTDEQHSQLVQQIKQAELKTSGEIRIHIENHHNGDPIKRALEVFKQLQMQKTRLKNGVLLYVAVKDRNFTVLGDKGIDRKVPDDFWETIKDTVIARFKNGEFYEGLLYAVEAAGENLKRFFPYERDDTNELINDISYHDN